MREKKIYFSNLNESLPALLPNTEISEIQKISSYLVIALHLASQTNMSSAISWLFVNLLMYPEHLEKVLTESKDLKQKEEWWMSPETLNQMEHLDKCIYETIRLAQQSITLRVVRKPMEVTQGNKTFTVPPGYYLATLLNVMNCRPPAVPDGVFPSQEFHPERYSKGKVVGCPSSHEYVVSTFGHAKHACPGRSFSINTFKVVMNEIFDRLELTPTFKEVKIPHTQMGAVARLDRSCWVEYKKKF